MWSTEGGASTALALGDLNGDGYVDLVTAGYSDATNGFTTIRLGTGDGSFGAARSYTAEGTKSLAVTLSDLNNDGVLDVVSGGVNAGDGYATIRLGAGDGTFGAAVSYGMESNSTNSVAVADLDGDGNMDLVTAGSSDTTNGFATVRLGAGDGTFRSSTSYATESASSYSVKLADLNSDGVFDLVTAGSNGADGYATIRLGTGSGSFKAALSYVTESGTVLLQRKLEF